MVHNDQIGTRVFEEMCHCSFDIADFEGLPDSWILIADFNTTDLFWCANWSSQLKQSGTFHKPNWLSVPQCFAGIWVGEDFQIFIQSFSSPSDPLQGKKLAMRAVFGDEHQLTKANGGGFGRPKRPRYGNVLKEWLFLKCFGKYPTRKLWVRNCTTKMCGILAVNVKRPVLQCWTLRRRWQQRQWSVWDMIWQSILAKIWGNAEEDWGEHEWRRLGVVCLTVRRFLTVGDSKVWSQLKNQVLRKKASGRRGHDDFTIRHRSKGMNDMNILYLYISFISYHTFGLVAYDISYAYCMYCMQLYVLHLGYIRIYILHLGYFRIYCKNLLLFVLYVF